jgi:hypothetical protein
MGFVVDKVALGQAFSTSTSLFPCQFRSTSAKLHGKTKKLITFIIGLHNKPQGCGASVASAGGPFTIQKTLKTLSVWSIKYRCIHSAQLLCDRRLYDNCLRAGVGANKEGSVLLLEEGNTDHF